MNYLVNRIKNIIRYVQITGGARDSDKFPVQQISYKGVVSNTCMLFPYGTYANVPVDALGVMFSIDGDESNTATIAYTPQKRPSGLSAGEVSHYHPETGDSVTFRNGGGIEVVSSGVVSISCTGDVEISGGNISITGGTVDVDANKVNLGSGGQPIARMGDKVAVNTVTGAGTITSGGANTSI